MNAPPERSKPNDLHAPPKDRNLPQGTLYLMPNTLDFGTADATTNLQELLPLGVIRIAARLNHWVAENAKSTRAFLKRTRIGKFATSFNFVIFIIHHYSGRIFNLCACCIIG